MEVYASDQLDTLFRRRHIYKRTGTDGVQLADRTASSYFQEEICPGVIISFLR